MNVSGALETTAGAAPAGALAATERMQHLQALIAQVEDGPAGFAAALQAAQADTGAAAAGTSGVGASGVGASAAGTSTAGLTTGLSDTGLNAAADAGTGAAGTTTAAAAYTPGAYAPAGYTVSAYPTAGVATPGAGAGIGTAAGAGATAGAAGTSAGATAYVPLIEQAAARNGVDPAVLYGLIEQESGFDPGATSGAGAVGLTQLMPGTAASLGVTEPLNPAQSIEGGARYLGEMLRQFGGNVTDALAAYNAGPGAVQQYGGVPPYAETQQYVGKVLANAAAFRQSGAGASAAGVDATSASPSVIAAGAAVPAGAAVSPAAYGTGGLA